MINLVSTIVLVSTLLGQSGGQVDLGQEVLSYVEATNQQFRLIEQQKKEVTYKTLRVEELQNDIQSIRIQPRIQQSYHVEQPYFENKIEIPVDPAPVVADTPVYSEPTPIALPSQTMPAQTIEAPAISNDYRIIIPSIGVNANIVDTDIYDETRWKEDLLRGVGHYGGNPGEGSKIVLTAHSSWWVPHEFGEVFRYLYKLKAGDQVFVDYGGQRYTYEVFKQEVVGPNTPSIVSNYGYEELTLFTCWPYNSWAKRLVVYTKKI